MRVSVEGRDGVLRELSWFPERLAGKASDAFARAVIRAQGTVVENCDNPLNVRTGALRRSIKTEVRGSMLKDIHASIYAAHISGGQPVVYAPIQEYGGTIRAKKAYAGVPGGPYLNIPAAANLTGAGVMKMDAATVFGKGGRLMRSRSGKWLVIMGNNIMFHLVKKVEIPPRLGMRDAAEAEVPTLISDLKNILKGMD